MDTTLKEIINSYTRTQLTKYENPVNIQLMNDIFDKEQMSILKQTMNKLIRLEYQKQSLKSDVAKLQYSLEARIQELQDSKKQFYFITINFDDAKILPMIRERRLQKFLIKKLDRTFVKDYIFCIEQRGEVNRYWKGFHVHILLQTSKHKKLSELVREFYNSFKNFVSDKQKVDIKLSTHCFLPRLKYILGMKKDEEKHAKQLQDKTFREEYGLLAYYTSNAGLYSI